MHTASEMSDINQLVTLGTKISTLVHETQKERGRTAGFMGSRGQSFGKELEQQRLNTNEKAAELQEFLNDFDATQFSQGQRTLSSASQATALQSLVGKFKVS